MSDLLINPYAYGADASGTLVSFTGFAGNNTAGTGTLAAPAGLQVGDVMFAILFTRNGSVNIQTPPGYTIFGIYDGGLDSTSFRRTATADSSDNIAWDINGTQQAIHAFAMRGAGTTFNVGNQIDGNGTTSLAITVPSVTTAVVGRDLIFVTTLAEQAESTAIIDIPAGYTQLYQTEILSAAGAAAEQSTQAVFSKTHSGGATGTTNITASVSGATTTTYIHGQRVVLTP